MVDLGDRAEVHRALRTVLATRPEEFPIFDATFDAFWGGLVAAASPPADGDAAPDAPQLNAHFPKAKDAALDFSGWADVAEGEGEPVGLPGVSDVESTMGKDFSSFGAADLARSSAWPRRSPGASPRGGAAGSSRPAGAAASTSGGRCGCP